MEPVPIPGIKLREVVLAQAVPSGAVRRRVAGAGKRLLVKRRGDVAILLLAHGVIIAAAVVPQAVVMVVRHLATSLHVVSHLLEIIREPGADAAWHKPRDRLTQLLHFARPHIPRHHSGSNRPPVTTCPSATSQPF